MPDYTTYVPDRVLGDYAAGWAASKIQFLEPLDRRITAVRDVHADYLAIKAAQCVLDLDWAVADYIPRNCLDHTTFFADFFTHPSVHRHFGGELGRIRASSSYERPLGFKWESSWTTTARLANFLSSGAIYSPSGLDDRAVLRLLHSFSKAAFRNQFSAALCHFSGEAWADWFDGWRNYSFCWIDKATGVMTLLLVTDTD